MTDLPDVAGVDHRWVRAADGCLLHVAEAGAGAPLLLLHGWPQHWYAWRHVVGPLAERFRVVCPDVRGLGWSQATGTDWSLRRLADDVRDVMDALGIERAGIVGHDWGGVTAYQLAMSHPRRVSRLMPLAALHPWTRRGIRPRTVWRPWHVYTAAALGGRLNNGALRVPEVSLRTWRHRGRFSRAELQLYTDSARRPDAALATTQYYRTLLLREVPYFWRHAHDLRIDHPILHLNGAQDPLTRDSSHGWQSQNSAMDLIELDSCGHFIPEERPQLLGYHITSFMEADR